MKYLLRVAALTTLASSVALAGAAPSWEFAGPTTYTARGDEPGAPSLSSAGAAQDVQRGGECFGSSSVVDFGQDVVCRE